MVQKWPNRQLEEVCAFQNGLWTGKRPPFVTAKVIRNTNFKNNDGTLNLGDVAEIEVEEKQLQARLLEKGDLILERSGGGPTQPVGRVVYFDAGGKFSFSNFTTRIRVRNSKELDRVYLWRYLNLLYLSGVTEKMQKQTTGIRNLNFPEYKNLEILLPPIAEQKKIVARLEGLRGKIKEAKRLRAEAQEAAQNLLPAELYKIFTTHSISSNHSLIRANRRIVKKPASVKNYGPLRRSSSEASEAQWEEKELGEICELNPKKSEVKDRADDLLVSFVPTSAVDEYLQTITSREERNLGEVRKGYTYFRNDDVLFAKITPCMENGKVAIARNLKNGIGFGTTEFHVIRAKKGVLPEWIHYIVGQPSFREIAKTRMTGSAGQKRVPVQFLEKFKIPLPPVDEQKKIVARLDSLSEKIKNLRQTQAETTENLKSLEQSVLHQAFSNSRACPPLEGIGE